MRRTASLLLALLLTVGASGCLRDDLFPEPYAWKAGPSFRGQGDSVQEIEVPTEAERFRFRLTTDFSRDTPVLGEQAGVEFRFRDPAGNVAAYKFTTSGEKRDTFGGNVGGLWRVTVSDPGSGARYDGAVEWFVPEHEDWAWWKVWQR